MSDATMTRPREFTAGVGVLGPPDVTEVVMVDDRTTGIPHHEQMSQDVNAPAMRDGAPGVKVW